MFSCIRRLLARAQWNVALAIYGLVQEYSYNQSLSRIRLRCEYTVLRLTLRSGGVGTGRYAGAQCLRQMRLGIGEAE